MKVELAFGLISALADFVYEGGRSAIPAIVKNQVELGLVSGLSEGLGYALRGLTGVLADVTASHFLFVLIGYSLVISYPLAAAFPSFEAFALAVIMERIGKALRSPAKDALVASNASDPGKAFAIIEMMDQLGAVLGPLTLFALSGIFGLQRSMLAFFIPYAVMMAILVKLRNLKARPIKKEVSWKFSSLVIFSFLVGASFAQPMLSAASAPEPVLAYALVMAFDALASYPLGKFYKAALYLTPLFSISSLSLKDWRFVPWAGVAIAYVEVVLRAAIAAAGGKGRLYGAAYAALGLGYLIGGAVMPLLNEFQLLAYSLTLSTLALFFLPKDITWT